MTAFHQRVAITSSTGRHIRFAPGALASALVECGAAAPEASAGRVRSVSLSRSADTHAVRIGDAGEPRLGVKFYRWVQLDEGARIVEHHPRCCYGEF